MNRNLDWAKKTGLLARLYAGFVKKALEQEPSWKRLLFRLDIVSTY